MTMQMIQATVEPATERGPDQLNSAWADFTAHGDVILNGTASWFTPSTLVVVSITELDGDGNPHMGDARMTVNNVQPYQGGVQVRVNIEWGSDLRGRLMYVY
ncbi:hypothetical protein E1264_12850 [Actinomadura sp. KC216]|uniref:hypothetical protein n=1 Tax=Actinomadura sp. KC216 TaxID=2530370 RepID=UPI00104720F3|nr:hypothetical protein [Actinomadura sp. KC216]TDB88009.1 hypothetical protein E1264_12850 [Actinomadura sp. KC216]